MASGARAKWSGVGISTPRALRACLVALLVSILALWAVVAATSVSRANSARQMAAEAVGALGEARDLYLALGRADAAASRELLLESTGDVPEERDGYDQLVREAGTLLVAIANDAGDSAPIRTAVEHITSRLPEYSADVDAARVYNRQGYPVAAAYLRNASELMQDELLPAATTIYVDAMRRVDSAGAAAGSRRDLSLVIAAAGLVAVTLVATQVLVAVRTRRVLNVGLVTASVLVAVVFGVTIGRFATMQSQLRAFQLDGQAQVQSLSVAQMLALRAQREDAGQLIERSADEGVFKGLADRIGGADGLISSSGDQGRIESFFQRFVATHESVFAADQIGDHPEAVRLFRASEVTRANEFDAQLDTAINAADAELARHAAIAVDQVDSLATAAALLAIIAMVSCMFGLTPRLREYR